MKKYVLPISTEFGESGNDADAPEEDEAEELDNGLE